MQHDFCICLSVKASAVCPISSRCLVFGSFMVLVCVVLTLVIHHVIWCLDIFCSSIRLSSAQSLTVLLPWTTSPSSSILHYHTLEAPRPTLTCILSNLDGELQFIIVCFPTAFVSGFKITIPWMVLDV